MSGESLEATPCREEIAHGLREVAQRISEVPKRVELQTPVSLTSISDDLGQAAECLNRVESGLYELWPADEPKA